MTAHELARQLLEEPDLPVALVHPELGRYIKKNILVWVTTVNVYGPRGGKKTIKVVEING